MFFCHMLFQQSFFWKTSLTKATFVISFWFVSRSYMCTQTYFWSKVCLAYITFERCNPFMNYKMSFQLFCYTETSTAYIAFMQLLSLMNLCYVVIQMNFSGKIIVTDCALKVDNIQDLNLRLCIKTKLQLWKLIKNGP